MGGSNPSLEVRLIFFIDEDPRGSPPDQSLLLDLTGGVTNAKPLTPVRAFRNLSEYDRFKVISDTWYTFTPSASEIVVADVNYVPKEYKIQINKNLKDHQAIFKEDALTGVYDDYTKGAICVMAISENETPGNVIISGVARLRYTDM